jgi:hypothetical protein
MRFKKSKDIIWEDTGIIKVHNFPADFNSSSYITKVYREFKKGEFGWKEVDGQAFYFHEMSQEQLSLATIIGTAQNALYSLCPNKKYLNPLK